MKKVVPVILRHKNHGLEILAFRHPLAGFQLVKGTIEKDEQYEQAAIRELFEESGAIAEPNPKFIGNFKLKSTQQEWYFYVCELRTDLAETWIHHCQDGGGLDFRFFWYSLDQQPDDHWHGTFKEALSFLRNSLTSS
ncbi:NUDIX hydrolase [Acinetobacter courvalinii]|jgi:8-oxo-dGTP pyrophosphatase MutT (NUDIX family)|uniref:NUDIX hydrolase n=1 Tax=Acinetobacter courvalinii TaxID=280147 RepID=UPI0018FF1FBC|nr:NUDIX domain-containing protein [Acinetobacter courvalinii]MBJ9957097.1 NUDIX domain-containing protein [Acinetobacter courvalinii]